MTEPTILERIAEELDMARLTARETDQFADRFSLPLPDAYRVLLRGIELRRRRNEDVVGVKLGFTSKEKAEQMGVADVILGVLTDEMQLLNGGNLDPDTLIHPRVEPEIAFRLADDVPVAMLAHDLAAHVTHVSAAVEVIDSRYRNFSFSLSDVLADNTSASHFAVGDWFAVTDELRNGGLKHVPVTLSINGVIEAAGSTNAILGDPFEALEAAQRLAGTHGHPIVPGGIVLAGSATAAVALPADAMVEVAVAGLGTVGFRTSRRDVKA